ncbi:MAG: MFS family permease, partial [Thermoproteota archaeon]
MLSLLRKHPRYIAFSFIIFFFSSLGQTFLLSLFNTDIAAAYGLSPKELSVYYSIATFGASLLLPFVGKLIDRINILKLTIFMALGVCLFLGLLTLLGTRDMGKLSVVLVFIYVFIRLLGQSSLPILASTFITRNFGSYRGRALAISSFGRSISEGIFPIIITSIIIAYDWKYAVYFLIVLVLFVFIPSVYFLLRNGECETPLYPEFQASSVSKKEDFKSKTIYTNIKIYYVSFFNSIIPFSLTGIYFYQSEILKFKELTINDWGQSFLYYSICQVLTSILAGILVDKYSAKKILFLILIPFTLGLYAITTIPGLLGLNIFMAFCGLSGGLSSNIKSSFWAETFSLKDLGKVKSLDSSFMVISTSIAPILFGVTLDYFSMKKILFCLGALSMA